MKNTLIAVAAVLILGAGGWYYVSSGKLAESAGSTATTTAASAAVATVNGQNISQAQLTVAESQITAQQGSTTTMTQAQIQTQAVNSLIAQALLQQATQKAGITASSTAVDAQIQADKTQLGSEAAYQQALTAQKMTENDLRAQISANFAMQEYLTQTLNLSAVTASDAEIQAFYKQAAAQQTGVPPLAQVRTQVKQLVIQQKQQQLIDALVQKLRSEGTVTVLI